MIINAGVPNRVSLSGGRQCLLRFFYVTILATVMCAWASGMAVHAAEVDADGAAVPTNFAGIVERVRPAVVGVRVKSDVRAPSDEAQASSPFPSGSTLDRLLRQLRIAPDGSAPRTGVSLGSGFFVSGDGYIVTNDHVVTGGGTIEVTTDDGKVHPAKVIGTDRQTDLALIKIDTQIDLAYVRLSKTEPQIGEWVLAIGYPFGLGGTVTAGIISARGRDIGEGPYDDFIQIDAPINEGNSGGPTFNVRGEVIGVNTLIYSPSGGSVGVAFDIPAETVRSIIQQLREKGRITRGWIGVDMQQVTPAIAVALGLKNPHGALIAQAEADGPAAKHGIGAGNVVTSINDQELKDPREVARIIAGIAPDTLVKFGVFQNGQEKVIMVKLGELPRTTSARTIDSIENETLGLTLASTSAILPGMEKGVVVMEISREGAAAASGLLADDIILDVDRQAVNTPADVDKVVSEAHSYSKQAVLLRFRRGDMSGFVAIPIN